MGECNKTILSQKYASNIKQLRLVGEMGGFCSYPGLYPRARVHMLLRVCNFIVKLTKG